jgi:hypothetical protein
MRSALGPEAVRTLPAVASAAVVVVISSLFR